METGKQLIICSDMALQYHNYVKKQNLKRNEYFHTDSFMCVRKLCFCFIKGQMANSIVTYFPYLKDPLGITGYVSYLITIFGRDMPLII